MGLSHHTQGSNHPNLNELLTMVEPVTSEPTPLLEMHDQEKELETHVYSAIKSDEIATKFFHLLQELHLTQYEKTLGKGAVGTVVQLKGIDKYSTLPLALKLQAFSQENAIHPTEIRGDVVALNLPPNKQLSTFYGVFAYDGNNVNFIEKLNPTLHEGQVIISTLSRAINGETLYSKIQKGTLPLHQIQTYCHQIAEGIHALHQAGYAHRDIHAENILIENNSIAIIDFGLSEKKNEKNTQKDWRKFGYILAEMGGDALLFDPKFFDLVYSNTHGLLNGNKPYTGKQILNHPFFKSF